MQHPLRATLALADAAPAVRWDGDIRHLPFVDAQAEDTTGEPALIVIQQDYVADFLHETRTRDIGPTVFAAHEPEPITPLASTP